MDNCLVASQGSVKFYAKNQALIDLAFMILEGNNFSSTHQKINVYIGIHEWIFDSLPNDILNIGIQTELLYDDFGRRYVNYKYSFLPKIYEKKFHVILDLSDSNYLAYEKPRNIFFGPYIFPEYKVIYNKNNNSNKGIFYGYLSNRRSIILKNFKKYLNFTVYTKIYYKELNPLIRQSRFVLGVHAGEGKYTEWPRLLLAYLRGKALVSELLCKNLLPGVHYLLINEIINDKKLNKTFKKVTEDFVGKFSFKKFLKKIKSHQITDQNYFHINFYILILIIQILYTKIFNKANFFHE